MTAYDQEGLVSLANGSAQVIDSLILFHLNDSIRLVCGFLTLLAETLSILSNSTTFPPSVTEGGEGDQPQHPYQGFCEQRLSETIDKVKERLGKLYTRNIHESLDFYRNEELEVNFFYKLIITCR